MKKFFILMPLVAVAFASCSNDEVQSQAVKQSTDAVTFLPAMNNATRGTIYTDANFSSVPGAFTAIINGKFYKADPSVETTPGSGTYPSVESVNSAYTVTYGTPTAGSWNLSQPLWWADGTSSFTAYAGEGGGTVSGGALSFSVASAVANQTDLVVAYNEGSRSDFSSGVPLHFRHALSQILVNASYADDASYPTFPSLSVKVKAIRFSNIYGNGSLALPTASTAAGETYAPAWTTTGSLMQYASKESEVTLTPTAQSIASYTADGPMLLLPQTQAAATTLASVPSSGAYLEVLADIDYVTAKDGIINLYPTYASEDGSTAGNEYEWIAVPVSISWDGGNKYTYTLNFSNIACGKVSPNATNTSGKAKGDDIISGVPYPVTFLVTVEDTWADGGTTTPAL